MTVDKRASLPIAAAGVLLILLPFACTQPRPPAPPRAVPPPAAGIYYEEELPAAQQLKVEIIDLRQTTSDDQNRVTLKGTLINRGTKATSEVSVKVSALDEHDGVVQSLYAVPDSSRIAAGGGTTTFTATMDNRPEVKRYHVEAIAK